MSKENEREKHRRNRNRRKPFEFSAPTKKEVWKRARGKCEHCRINPGSEYHHVTTIEFAIQRGLDPSSVNCKENCSLLCTSCHILLDKTSVQHAI